MEVYDGVSSSHDPKAAAVIAKLQLERISQPWRRKSDDERRLRASIRTLEMYDKSFHANVNRLEGMLATFWPGTGSLLNLGSATLLATLSDFGGPEAVASRPCAARKRMGKVGGPLLKEEKIDRVIESAEGSLGVSMLLEEREALKELAKETERIRKARSAALLRVEKLTESVDCVHHLAGFLGKATAAVLFSSVGDPRSFGSASAYLKAFGLNLKLRSSGKSKGHLKITKRGPSIARRWLYLAVLRVIQKDEIVRAWYQKEVAKMTGYKIKALVAVMRKLVRALWHMGRTGEAFDSSRLFDTSTLAIPKAA